MKSGSKKLLVKEGETVLAKISGEAKKGEKIKLEEILRNDQPDPIGSYETGALERIVGPDGKEVPSFKFGEAKAEGQDELVKKLGELKAKKPEDIEEVKDFVDFISDEKNKDKRAEIKKMMSSEEGQ